MPAAEYENRTDSVLAWKKAQKLGRFDPNAPSIEQQKILASEREVEERGKRHIPISFYTLSLHTLPPIPFALCNSRSNLHYIHEGEQKSQPSSVRDKYQMYPAPGGSKETAAYG